jgi:hypothetical protein
MGATLSTISELLKTQYLDGLNQQFNDKNFILSQIERNYDSVAGKNFTMDLHTGRNEGIGNRNEGGTLPTAGQQAFKETIVPMSYFYGKFSLTGQAIAAAKGGDSAYANILTTEMNRLEKDMRRELNRQLFGDGTAALTVCGTTSNSTTVNVVSTARLYVGMPIDVVVTADGTTSTGAVGRTVASITNGTSFVISGAAITTGDTFSVYRAGNWGTTLCMGLNGICSDSSALQGITPNTAATAFWKAQVRALNGAITESAFQTMLDNIEQHSNGETNLIVTSYGVRRAYVAVLNTYKQIVTPQKLEGGFEVINYNGKTIYADRDCPAGNMYFLDTNTLKFLRMSDFKFMDLDGNALVRGSNDSYEGTMFLYHNLGCNARNANGVITGITEA